MAERQVRYRSHRGRWLLLAAIGAAIVVIGLGAYYGRGFQRERQAQAGLRDGQSAAERGEWGEAARLLGRYLSRYPDDHAVLAIYAEANLRKRPFESGALAQAASAYRRILRVKPDDPVAFDRLATLFESSGNFAELGQVAAARLQAVPGDLRAALATARDLLSRQKPADVLDLLEPRVADLRPGDDAGGLAPEVYIVLAEAELALTQGAGRDAALRWLDQAVERYPGSPLAHVQRAALYIQAASAKPDAAADELRRTAAADLAAAEAARSTDPRVALALVDQWITLGDFARAETCLRYAESLDEWDVQQYIVDPSNWRAACFLQAGRLCLLTGRLDEGVRRAREALSAAASESARFAILPTVIELYARGGQLKDAHGAYDEYVDRIERLPNVADYKELATLLGALLATADGDYYKVINLLEPLAARPNRPAGLRAMLGEAYARTGQVRRLADMAQRGGSDGSMSRLLAARAARSFADRGEWARATDVLDTLSADDQADIEIRLLRLGIRLGQGEAESTPGALADAVVAELRPLRDEYPRRVDVRLLMANAALLGGNDEAAEAELRDAVANCDNPAPAAEGLARLLAGSGRGEEAERVLRDVAATHGEQAATWIVLAQFLYERGRTREAIEQIAAGLEKVSDQAGRRDLRLRQAVLRLQTGERQAARDMLLELASGDGANVDARVMLLELPEVLADAPTAQRLVDELKAIEGDNGLNWRYQQARVWLGGRDWQTRFEDARALLAYCISADPSWSAPVLVLGAAHERRGDLSNAEATYKSGYRATGDVVAADRLLSLLQRQRRFVEARELLQRIERNLGRRAVAARQIQLALGEGRVADALSLLEMGAAGGAGEPAELLRLATLAYGQKRDAARALELVERAAEAGADPVEVARVRSAILQAEGRSDEAVAALTSLIGASPSAQAYLLRGALYAELQRRSEADADFAALAQLSDTPNGVAVQGEYFAQTDRLDRAIETWESGLRTFPDSPLLMRGIARGRLVRNGDGDLAAAVALLDRLDQLEPNSAENISIRVTALLIESKPGARARILPLLRTALGAPPAPPAAYVQMASVALTIDSAALAEQLAQRGLTFEPDDIGLLMLRSEAALALGNLDMARELARTVQRRDPARRRAREILLEVASARGDAAAMREGLADIEARLGETPGDLGLQSLRARTLIALGEAGGTVREIEAFVASGAGAESADAWLELARLYLLARDLPDADRCIEKAESLAPGDTRADLVRLDRLAIDGTPADLMALGDKAIRRGPAGAAAALRIAALLAAAPDQAEPALRLAERIVAVDPQNADAHRLAGDLAHAQGDLDSAERAYRAAIAIDPGAAPVLNNLGWIMAQDRGNPAEGLTLAQRAVDLDPNEPNYRDTLAAVLRLLKRDNEALAEYRRAVALFAADSPARDRALYALATLAAELGELRSISAFSAELAELAKRDPRRTLSGDERAALATIVNSLGTP